MMRIPSQKEVDEFRHWIKMHDEGERFIKELIARYDTLFNDHVQDFKRLETKDMTPDLDPNEQHIRSILAETVHTAFRKGCDGGGSFQVWTAIRNMDNDQWGNAIEWMIYCLDVSGYEIKQKKKK
jgi:hypothetical protein